MDPATLAGLILLAGIVIGIVYSVPIAVVIGTASFLAAIPLLGLEHAVIVTAQRVFTGINSFPLLAIPLFVLAGVIMNTGGIAGRLVDAAKVLTGRMFGSVSGAAVAAAAAVGSVMNPRMVAEGYDRRFAASVNVASASSGMLLPPSNTFIVYALVSGSSIAALFMAGIGPGLLWALACMVVVYAYARKQPGKLKSDERVTFAQGAQVMWRAAPSLLMIVVVIGGILGGFFTATESASIAVVYCLLLSAIYRTIGFKHLPEIAVVYCLILGLIYRTLRLKDLPGILVEAGRTTAIVMLLVGVSTALSFVMTFAGIPDAISGFVLGLTDSPTVVLLLMMAVLILIGTVMDPTPAILIFVPIFLPIATEFGIDPVHFGAMVVMNLSLGVITPPIGNVLFVGSRVAGLPIEPVIGQLWRFLGMILLALLLVVFIPHLSVWLPTVLGLM